MGDSTHKGELKGKIHKITTPIQWINPSYLNFLFNLSLSPIRNGVMQNLYLKSKIHLRTTTNPLQYCRENQQDF